MPQGKKKSTTKFFFTTHRGSKSALTIGAKKAFELFIYRKINLQNYKIRSFSRRKFKEACSAKKKRKSSKAGGNENQRL